MRIAVVTEHYWPEVGGAEVMLRRLAHCWAAGDHPVTVVTRRWLPETAASELDGSVRIVRLPLLRVRLLGTLHFHRQLRRWLAENRESLDVVYVSMLKHAAFASLQECRRLGLPIVLRPEGAGETGDVHWQQTARGGRRIARLCRQAPAIVAPSPVIQQEMLDAGYSPDAVHFIPNGVPVPDQPWSLDDVRSVRDKLGLSQRVTVCYVGRLHPMKGVYDLIEAVSLIPVPERPQLLIIGDGPAAGELKQLTKQLRLSDDVVFAGQVADATAYLRASELFVLPSYQEGLSVSLLEAAVLGMPLLASDIAANRDVLPTDLLPLFPIRDPARLAQAVTERLTQLRAGKLDLLRQRSLASDRYSITAVAERHLQLFASM